MKELFRKHYPALILAFFTGLVLVSPQLYLISSQGGSYQGVFIAGVDAEIYYHRIKEISDGNILSASPAVYEYKNEPYTFGFLSELTVVFLAKLLGLETNQIIVASSFLFPFFLLLLFYVLVWQMTRSRIVALAISSGMIFLSNLVLVPKDLVRLFMEPSEVTLNIYNRIINPQTSSLYFFLWLLFFGFLLQNDRKPARWLLPGIFFGLLFYAYPYAWMYAVVLQGVLLIYYLMRKNTAKMVRRFSLSSLAGIIISIPYWVNYWQLVRHQFYQSLVKHQGFVETHAPLFSKLLFFDFLLLFLLFKKKKESEVFVLLAGLVVSGFVLLNQQVITGLRFFPGHWHWYYFSAITVFLSIYVVYLFLENYPKLKVLLTALIIALGFGLGISSQINHYRVSGAIASANQRYGPLFSWLEQNAAKGSVVLAADPLSTMIPAYTSSDHYLVNLYDALNLVPDDRVNHSFFVEIYLRGARSDNLDQFINQKTPEFNHVLFGYWRRYAYGCTECFPEEELRELKAKYLEFLNRDFEQELKKYRLDYLVVDRKTNIWHYQDLKFIGPPTTTVGDFEVYRIN